MPDHPGVLIGIFETNEVSYTLHELVLVEGLISEVLDLAHQKKGRVIGFKVAIGELAQFENSLIEELLFQLVKGTELETAKIVVEIEKSEVKCLYCGIKS